MVGRLWEVLPRGGGGADGEVPRWGAAGATLGPTRCMLPGALRMGAGGAAGLWLCGAEDFMGGGGAPALEPRLVGGGAP